MHKIEKGTYKKWSINEKENNEKENILNKF